MPTVRRSAGVGLSGSLPATIRAACSSARVMSSSKGILHVDGYAGFETLTGDGDVVLAACWAHTQRKFYEVVEATGSPVATEALRRIGELYAIEAEARGRSAAYRLAARRSFSRPVVGCWPIHATYADWVRHANDAGYAVGGDCVDRWGPARRSLMAFFRTATNSEKRSGVF